MAITQHRDAHKAFIFEDVMTAIECTLPALFRFYGIDLIPSKGIANTKILSHPVIKMIKI